MPEEAEGGRSLPCFYFHSERAHHQRARTRYPSAFYHQQEMVQDRQCQDCISSLVW